MPITHRRLTASVAFIALNAGLWATINPVYDFICDLPFWEAQVLVGMLTNTLRAL